METRALNWVCGRVDASFETQLEIGERLRVVVTNYWHVSQVLIIRYALVILKPCSVKLFLILKPKKLFSTVFILQRCHSLQPSLLGLINIGDIDVIKCEDAVDWVWRVSCCECTRVSHLVNIKRRLIVQIFHESLLRGFRIQPIKHDDSFIGEKGNENDANENR